MLKIITVTNQPERAMPLIRSLVANKWDYVLIQPAEWKGWGTKLVETHHYLKANPDVTEFIFCDAHDVICFGDEEEFREKMKDFTSPMLISTEKACWPVAQNHIFFEKHPSGFSYINSGLYYAKSAYFIEMFEKYPVEYHFDDQLWLQGCFMKEEYGDMCLDYWQHIFNSHSFIAENEYSYNNSRVQIFESESLFLHKNGGTIDEKLNAMMKL